MLGGYKSVDALADALDLSGSRRTRLYEAERGELALPFPTLREIAEVCGLPVEFFSVDFARLPEISDDPRAVIARETAAAAERSRKRREKSGEELPLPREEGGTP